MIHPDDYVGDKNGYGDTNHYGGNKDYNHDKRNAGESGSAASFLLQHAPAEHSQRTCPCFIKHVSTKIISFNIATTEEDFNPTGRPLPRGALSAPRIVTRMEKQVDRHHL